MKFTLEPATDSTHKWVGVFTDETTKDPTPRATDAIFGS